MLLFMLLIGTRHHRKSTSVLLKNKKKYDAKCCMCDFFKPAETDVFCLWFVF